MMAQDSTHPTGVVAEDDRTKEALRARNRKANAALQLRANGADWEQVAEVLGFPTARAALVATENALEKELRSESKELLVRMVDKRLESLLKSTWKKAHDQNSPEHLNAVTKSREIIADFRRLHGLDKPTEVSLYSPNAAEVEAWVAEHMPTNPALVEDDIFDVDFIEEEPKELEAPDAVPAE